MREARSTLKAQAYTVFIVGSHSTAVRKLQVSPGRVRVLGSTVAAVLIVLALAAGALGTRYAALLAARNDAEALRRENAQLRTQMAAVEQRVAHIASTLDRVDAVGAELRATAAGLQPGREAGGARPGVKGSDAASGPTRESSDVAARTEGPPGDRTTAGAATAGPIQLLPAHPRPDVVHVPSASLSPPDGAAAGALASLERAATRQEGALRAAQEYFAEQRKVLAATPASWPARGFVTSDFGDRLDPYTAERMMHRGLDIAAAPGTAVYAPSDATVAFAGTETGYGKVLILDHGNGVNTRYGHLAQILVKRGERVELGERVATIGSTGRSTGPHLHYEVRVNGIAENPRKFILQ